MVWVKMCPSVAPLQSHFDGGEISPLLQGRVDSERYKSSLALCKNWIPMLQGPLKRRSGTVYVAGCKNNTAKGSRLIPFNFSTTQSYILEFSAGKIRFFSNYGPVLLMGVPYEVTTSYVLSDLPNLKFVQSADVLYIVHPDHQPAKLVRKGATNWTITPIVFQDGPYLPINTSPMTFTASGTTGSVTVTTGPIRTVAGTANVGGVIEVVTTVAHGYVTGMQVYITGIVGTTEANGQWTIIVLGDPTTSTAFTLTGSTFVHAWISGGTVAPTNDFLASTGAFTGGTPIGTPVRMEVSSKWGWGQITVTNSPINFTMQVQGALNGTGATISWATGVWPQSSFITANGTPVDFYGGTALLGIYPDTVTFHEDRLCFAGAPAYPQRVDMSSTSNYENFSPSQVDTSVISSNAVSLFLNATDVNLVEFLGSDEKGLIAGSTSAEWQIRPSTLGEALTPTNLLARRGSKWGAANFMSFLVGKATLYIQRGSRKLRELLYDFYIDGYRATDLTELAEHITGTGVVDWTYQSIPLSIVWLVRADGALLGMTYDRDMRELRTGWHWHILGGVSDAAGSPAIVESVAVIPSPDGTRDDLWMIVRRYINGSVSRTVEYMQKVFEDIDLQQNAVMLDASSTYNSSITITGATQANPISIHAPSHGFSTADYVRIDSVLGITVSGVSLLNGKRFKITKTDNDNFTLQNNDTNANVDGTSATAYVSGGQVRKLVTTISGLTYLENETVSILADGAVISPQVVSNSGVLTLPVKAAIVTIGYPYNSDAQLLRLEAGARNGTSLGKTRRMHRVALLVHQSQGLSIGKDFNNLDPVQFRVQGVDPNTGMPSLAEGMETHTLDLDYDMDNKLCMRANQPLPCAILGVYPMLETQDRA